MISKKWLNTGKHKISPKPFRNSLQRSDIATSCGMTGLNPNNIHFHFTTTIPVQRNLVSYRNSCLRSDDVSNVITIINFSVEIEMANELTKKPLKVLKS